MKKFLLNFKPIVLFILLFLVVIFNTFLCYAINPIRQNYNSWFYLLTIGIVVLFVTTILLLFFFKKKTSGNLLIPTVTTIILSAVILTIVFRVMSLVNEKNLFAKTGLISVIILFCYYVIILAFSYLLSFKKGKQIKE